MDHREVGRGGGGERAEEENALGNDSGEGPIQHEKHKQTNKQPT